MIARAPWRPQDICDDVLRRSSHRTMPPMLLDEAEYQVVGELIEDYDQLNGVWVAGYGGGDQALLWPMRMDPVARA